MLMRRGDRPSALHIRKLNMIIGISGYARTGKDEVAKVLVEEFEFERLAFADKLRECVYALNPIVVSKDLDAVAWLRHLQDVIDDYGWDGVKETPYGPEVRRLLQRFGTEVGRNILGGNIWVDATFRAMKPNCNYIITDCRFENEAKAVQDDYEGGKMWRINRPGVGPVNDHISEIGLDNFPFDTIIDNDGDLTDLRDSVRLALKFNQTT